MKAAMVLTLARRSPLPFCLSPIISRPLPDTLSVLFQFVVQGTGGWVWATGPNSSVCGVPPTHARLAESS